MIIIQGSEGMIRTLQVLIIHDSEGMTEHCKLVLIIYGSEGMIRTHVFIIDLTFPYYKFACNEVLRVLYENIRYFATIFLDSSVIFSPMLSIFF